MDRFIDDLFISSQYDMIREHTPNACLSFQTLKETLVKIGGQYCKQNYY